MKKTILITALLASSIFSYSQVKKKTIKKSSFYPSTYFTGSGASNVFKTYTSGDTTIQEVYSGKAKNSYYWQTVDSTSVEITYEKPYSLKGVTFADSNNNLKYYPADSIRIKKRTTWIWQKLKKVYKVKGVVVKTTAPKFEKMMGAGMSFSYSRYNEVDEKAEFYFHDKRIQPIQAFPKDRYIY